ncbi:MAG: MFS transporter [Cytophagaceae bacterium]|nr:MFS transporter [Cytophagaceae bacterium]
MDKRLYSNQFWLLCASNFLFTISFNMIMPELPGYLRSLGGAQYIGLIVSLFTLTAGVSRPFSGKLTDTIGRVPIMAFGSLVCFVCGLLYPLVSSVSAFLILRLFHGFSTGFKPTATSAYVADLIPENRRGEALGTLGIALSLGMSSGPPLGSYLAAWFGLNVMFYVSSVFALLSILILVRLKETLSDRERFRPGHLVLQKQDLFEPKVLATFVVMLLLSYSTGAVITLAPDLSDHLGLPNKGIFFAVYTMASLVIRLVASKSSDRYGRVRVLRISALALVVSMILLANANSPTTLLLSAVLFGLAGGMAMPTITAWTVDLSDQDNRGRAIATMYIALEMGIGIGAYTGGWLYAGNIANIAISFYIAALLAAVALVYMTFRKSAAFI